MSLTWTTASASTTQSIVNTEVEATLTFKDNDIRAVYIDWDDGVSNKLEEANYQWYQTTEPISTTTIKHTYNSTGTFSPVIQAVNSDGFVSRYFGSTASNTEIKPYSQDSTINNIAVFDDASNGVLRTTNTTVKSGIDNTVYDLLGPSALYICTMPTLTDTELAYFSPIEVDITCILDLTLSDGDSSLQSLAPIEKGSIGTQRVVQTLNCVLSGTGLTGETGLKNVLHEGTHDGQPLVSGAAVVRVLEVKYKNPKYMGASGKTAYTENAALNKLKIGLFTAHNRYSAISTGRGLPICYITAGDPIKRANDVERSVTIDYSQSRTAAANSSITEYFYDNGKVWFQPTDSWLTSGATSTLSASIDASQTTIPVTNTSNFPSSGDAVVGTSGWEYISYNGVTSTHLLNVVRGIKKSPLGPQSHNSGVAIQLGDYKLASTFYNNIWQITYPYQTTSTKTLSYTYLNNPYGFTLDEVYNPWKMNTAKWSTTDATAYVEDQFALDDFGRLMDQTYLLRSQAKAGTVNSYKNKLNMPHVFRITPVRSWAWNPGSSTTAGYLNARTNPTKILDSGATNADSDSKDYTTKNMENGSANQISLSGTNDHVWRDADNNTRTTPLEEYIILLFDEKTDKIFLNMTNWAPYLQSAIGTDVPWGIDSVSLLKVENSGTNIMNTFWEPVEFNDGTMSMKEYRDETNDTYSTVKCSLSKNGLISYDMIDNWESVKLEDLTGGEFSSYTSSSNDYDFGIMNGTVSGSVQNGNSIGDYFVITGTSAGDIEDKLSNTGLYPSDIGSMRYIAEITSPAAYDKNAFWISKDGDDGWDDDALFFHIGDSSATLRDNCQSLTGGIEFVIRRINIYDVFTGFSKVYRESGSSVSNQLLGVDSQTPALGFANEFCLYTGDNRGDNMGESIEQAWFGQQKYAVKIGLSGTMDLTSDHLHPELWNIFDANQPHSSVVTVKDDSAYNLNSLAITSSVSIGRAGVYYKAITHKGKVIITKTGIALQEVGFSSVALGDENSTTAFDDHGPSTLYGHLHTLRKIQAEDCRVFWDEPQKDGTFVRLFGVVQNVNETAAATGPRRVVNYNFTMTVDGVALLDTSGRLMTDIFPLGGIEDEQTYT